MTAPASARRSVLLPLVGLCLGVVCVPSSAEIRFVETDRLRVLYFDPAGAHLVPHATQSFVTALESHRERFSYDPDDAPTLLLQDFSDRGNATTILGAPRNRIFLDIAPVTLSFETFSPAERMATLANHETVHLVTSDLASPEDARFRRWFSGKVAPVAEHPESILYFYLTNPRASTPRWYTEGSAVFMETWMGGGLGRAQGGYDEMVFRAMVRDGAAFYDPLALVAKGTEVDFQVGANAYLYGTRFLSYLALQYTPERLIDWLRRDAGTHRSYSRDFQRVYGVPLEQAWRDWVAWEHEFQRRNLESVREHPITQPQDVARRGLGAISRAFVSDDEQELYAAVRYPGRVPHLVAISLQDGSVRELEEIRGAMAYRVASLAYDPASATLFYTSDNLSWRNLMAYDLKSGRSRKLLDSARIGDLAFDASDRSLWGLRTNNGFVILVRVPFPYTTWEQVHVFPYNEVAFDLDVSPDGKMVSASVAGPDPNGSGSQVMQLRVWRKDALLAGDPNPMRRVAFGNAVPEGFTFSPDGQHLYGSSYYTGVSNVYRYEISTGRLEALSNAEVGFFRPLPLGPDSLLVFHYTADGFVPATIPSRPTEDLSAITFLGERIATEHPVVQGWVTPPPSQVPFEEKVSRSGTYRPTRELGVEAVYPVVEGYKDSVAFGLHGRFSDPIGFDSLALTASYSPDESLDSSERLHASASYRHAMWTVEMKWNGGDFYDLFGPTKRSREGFGLDVGYERPIRYKPPETMNLLANAAYYSGLDALPAFQNVPTTLDRLLEADVGIEYENLRGSIGKVDEEAGHAWSVMGHVYQAGGETIPALLGQFDVGYPLPLRHSSVWLRAGAGVSGGDRDDPLAQVYFGGFGNNYVDNGEVKRYRDLLRLPGFDIDALSGQSFAKTMLEWNLPPIRFAAAGRPDFFASWARPAVFATALVTDLVDGDFRRGAYNAGVQVDIQLQVMHRLPMMLSFGYASGFGGGGRGEDEFMVSLKVL